MANSKKKRALITGAGGFIGSHLVRRLLESNWEVVALLHRHDAPRLKDYESKMTRLVLDWEDKRSVELAFDGVDCVFHLASAGVKAGISDEESIFRGNTELGFLVARAARSTPKLVWLGSGFEYDLTGEQKINERKSLAPQNFYAAAKLAGWTLANEVLKNSKTEMSTVRLFSAYGPGESTSRFIPYVITQAIQGLPIKMSEGSQVRDYLFVRDVVDGLLFVSSLGVAPSSVVNLGFGEGNTLRDLASKILEITQSPSEIQFGAYKSVRAEPTYMVADVDYALKLGWSPGVSLLDGLTETISWYKHNKGLWGAL